MQFWRLIRNQGRFFSLGSVEVPDGKGGTIIKEEMIDLEGQEQDEADGGDRYIPDEGFVNSSHPKLAFNFTMEVQFASGETFGSDKPETMKMAVKSMSRPSPTINYTDVNYYNYRTKVATSIDYGTVNLEYYDDGTNEAHRMMRQYLNAVSPASNVSGPVLHSGDGGIKASPFGKYSGIGALERELGVIAQIRVYHYYNSFGNTLRTEYIFQNPKVASFNLGELSMVTNDVTTIGFTFNFDFVYINDYALDEKLDNVGEVA